MTPSDISTLSSHIQWFGSFAILLLVFSRFNKYKVEIRIIGFIGLFSFVLQLLQEISSNFYDYSYLNEIGDASLFIETLLLISLYYYTLIGRVLKSLIVLSAIVCCILYGFLFVYSDYHWYSILSSYKSIVMIIFSIVFFFKTLTDLPEENLLSLPMFWINAGILFYFSCSFILSLTIDYLVNTLKDDLTTYWAFRNLLRALFCFMLGIGIWQARKK
jgi:hypothetical protein